jgi:hypothetical protein
MKTDPIKTATRALAGMEKPQTRQGLPPVYLTIPAREADGIMRQRYLNGGLSTEEASTLFHAGSRLNKLEETQEATEILGSGAAFIFVIIGAVIGGIDLFVQHSKPTPDISDTIAWATVGIGACIGAVASGISLYLGQKIEKQAQSVTTAAEPLMGRLIDFCDVDTSALAEELDRQRTSANNNPTPEVQTAFLQALNAIAEYAQHAKIRPDLDLARVASAKHLYNDPAVKAIAENQKAIQKAKSVTLVAARTAVNRLKKAAEDAETLHIAHTHHASDLAA